MGPLGRDCLVRRRHPDLCGTEFSDHHGIVSWLQCPPLALLAGIVYLLGMVTGGSLLSLLRWSLEGSRRRASSLP
jgi:hypothetical protein